MAWKKKGASKAVQHTGHAHRVSKSAHAVHKHPHKGHPGHRRKH